LGSIEIDEIKTVSWYWWSGATKNAQRYHDNFLLSR
jgi:hypothetical protein